MIYTPTASFHLPSARRRTFIREKTLSFVQAFGPRSLAHMERGEKTEHLG